MTKKKAPGATNAGGQTPINPVQGTEGEEMSTQNTTSALAGSVELLREIPESAVGGELHEGWGVIVTRPQSGEVNFHAVPGPTGPRLVGEPITMADGSVHEWLGLYRVRSVEDGVIVGELFSQIPCPVYAECRGHDAYFPEGEEPFVELDEHAFADMPIASLYGFAFANVYRTVQNDGAEERNVEINLERRLSSPHEIEELSAQLDVAAARLRAEAREMAGEETFAPIPVDARFAGGTVFVHAEPLPWEPSEAAVRLAMPGLDVALRPHEARALAAALLRAAVSA